MRPKKKVGLKDVAAALGVSVVTASNALSGKGGVSEENRERILKKAEELGYVYSPKSSKGVKKEGRPEVCIFWRERDGSPELPTSGENLAFLRALTAALTEAGFAVSAENAGGSAAVAGGFWPEDALMDLCESFQGTLCVVENFSSHVHTDYVVSDRFHAAYEKVKERYRQGYREDLFPNFPRIDPASAETGTRGNHPPTLSLVLDPDGAPGKEAAFMEGFLLACFSYDIADDAIRESYLLMNAENGGDVLFKNRKDFLQSLSGKKREYYPDGVLCTSRKEAEFLSAECRERGIRFPLGISDFGAPDLKAAAQMTAKVLKKRLQGEPCPEGVHLVREMLQGSGM